ncbi:MAG TPA: YebC/PmpR family DNA-binding transcriptional regulator [Candidatus Saccharimonadales bacterium]|nr:YebC/PmpR family DNA-binding transcriptional regulator [Candidatus Saccharimonadales bacterium]
MSGHSKWSTIKRQKGANDAKRGQAFTKAGRAITIAAKEGGGNPDANFKLRLAIEAARAINMPKDNIDRAVSRATGEGSEKALEEVTYEGFGPAGVALIIEVVTDNKMRSASDVRSTLDRNNGNLAGPGSVAYLFKPKGELVVNLSEKDPDELFLLAADSGAEDIDTHGEEATIFSSPEQLLKVKEAVEKEGYLVVSSEVVKEPTTTVKITQDSQAKSVLSLVEKLEELDDVQKVYANFDISEEMLEENMEVS